MPLRVVTCLLNDTNQSSCGGRLFLIASAQIMIDTKVQVRSTKRGNHYKATMSTRTAKLYELYYNQDLSQDSVRLVHSLPTLLYSRGSPSLLTPTLYSILPPRTNVFTTLCSIMNPQISVSSMLQSEMVHYNLRPLVVHNGEKIFPVVYQEDSYTTRSFILSIRTQLRLKKRDQHLFCAPNEIRNNRQRSLNHASDV